LRFSRGADEGQRADGDRGIIDAKRCRDVRDAEGDGEAALNGVRRVTVKVIGVVPTLGSNTVG